MAHKAADKVVRDHRGREADFKEAGRCLVLAQMLVDRSFTAAGNKGFREGYLAAVEAARLRATTPCPHDCADCSESDADEPSTVPRFLTVETWNDEIGTFAFWEEVRLDLKGEGEDDDPNEGMLNDDQEEGLIAAIYDMQCILDYKGKPSVRYGHKGPKPETPTR